MLCEITIENVAVIEKATAVFSRGFTVLTGETGAGKSILIDSINAILGNRTSRDIVRKGAEKAKIWARFQHVPGPITHSLAEAGYETEDDLLLSREISADGKSACRINGAPATAALLRAVCGGLVNIHGQHDNQSLLDAQKHVDVLDAFAANAPLRQEYGAAFQRWTGIRKEMQALSLDEDEKLRRMDLLRYETQQIEEANLAAGEEETLLEKRNLVLHAKQVVQALNHAYLALNGGEEGAGAALLLADAARGLTAAGEYAPELAAFGETLQETYYTVSELASDLQGRLDDFEYGGQSLESIEERLDVLYRLKQKYGPTVEDVLVYGRRAQEQLENMVFSAERLQVLQRQEAQAAAALQKLARQLSASRAAAFAKIRNDIAEALAFLNMPGIEMALLHREIPCGANGQDDLEFLISTNPGEKPKPLSRIASGGELARIMLALKSALADKDDIATVIYDEIDTGISGAAAGRIGELLQKSARGRQVICVTHTAQIAAYAERHLLIEKEVAGGRTFTHIRELDRAQRVNELARIVSGDRVTEISLANAEEMLQLGAAAEEKEEDGHGKRI